MSRLRAAFLAPGWTVLLLLFVAPLGLVAAYSFLERGAYGGIEWTWTLENYRRLADPLYGAIVARSLWIAALTTVFCLILGFPLALFITRAGRWQSLLLMLVILPFWTSYLIRTYAWMFLLRDTGLINMVLAALGLISEPLPMLYNDGAVVLGLVYAHLPFMVLPLFATLERIDSSLLEAAADLGAAPASVFVRVLLPLAAPGIVAGSVLVFIPSFGAYLTPDLLGGGKTIMVGNLVQNQFTTARDWPFGAAVSLVLISVAGGLVWLGRRWIQEDVP
jgi:spermidine/putrescine transport system permease protein